MNQRALGERIAGFQRRDISVEQVTIVGGLLKLVGTVELQAVKRFAVAENFKKGNIVGGRQIVWIGDNFYEHFDDYVEEDVPACTIFVWELVKGSKDPPIIGIFGGPNFPGTETYLAHTFQLMELGEKAHMRLDGWANISYKRSPKDGRLWVPRWSGHDGRLLVEANSSSNPDAWREGSRVSSS